MNSVRRRPVWLPAAVASVTMLLVLVLFEVIASSGPGWFDSGSGRLPGAVVAVVVLLLAGFLGTWWAVRGLAQGSSLVPVFLSTWMVLVIATALASLGAAGVRSGGAGLVDGGVLFGPRWGWIAALLATLAWFRRGEASAPEVEEPQPRARGEAGVVPEGGFVMKRASDFPDLTLDAGTDRPAPAADPEPVGLEEDAPTRTGGSHRREDPA